MPNAIARLGTLQLKELGEDELHQPRLLEELEADGWARGEKNFVELGGDAFGRNDLNAWGVSPDGCEGVGVDEESELGGKADGAHHAQRVIAECDVGVEWRAQGERLHVVKSIEGIHELSEAVGVEANGQRIDGKVAPLLVFL